LYQSQLKGKMGLSNLVFRGKAGTVKILLKSE
jgi:hypothetical protein